MTTLPAVVRIVDLPAATTITGAELLEVVQTASGVGLSAQVSLTQAIASIGGLPTGGGTGNLLVKTSGTSYAAAFTSIINGSVGIVGTALVTGAFGVVGTAQFTGAFNVVGTAQFTSSAFNVVGTASFTGVHNVVGTTQITGSLTAVGTSNFTGGPFGVQATATFTGIVNVVGTTIITGSLLQNGTTLHTGTFILGSQGAGLLQSSATGVVSATTAPFILLNTLSPSAIASVADTTSFTTTYKNYLITFENVTPANNTTTFQMQVATTGVAFISAASYISMAMVNVSSVVVTDTSTTALLLSGTRATTALQSSALYGLNGFIRLTNPAGTVARKAIVGEVSYIGAGASVATTTLAQAVVNGIFDGNSNAITGVNFLFSAGNIATGVIKIYGSP